MTLSTPTQRRDADETFQMARHGRRGGRHRAAGRGLRIEQLEQLSSSRVVGTHRQRPSATATARRRARPSFGTPKKATGSPYVFGMINDETGPVTFPEARQGAIAADATTSTTISAASTVIRS